MSGRNSDHAMPQRVTQAADQLSLTIRMKRLYVPTIGPCSWRTLLADPQLHWKRGASAMELAISWELAATSASGLPQHVAAVLDQHPATADAELLFAVPEHRVPLPGGGRASQTDLWAVLKVRDGWASVAVEGKAGEPFGPTVREWREEMSRGKATRLEALCRTLAIDPDKISNLRYQLFHRSASAVLEAKRIGAKNAVVLVQNFRADTASWSDFEAFVKLFCVCARRNGICEATCPDIGRLLFAWVDCRVATDAELASLM